MRKMILLSLMAAFSAVAFAGEPKFAPIKMVLGPGIPVATSITAARYLEAAVEKKP